MESFTVVVEVPEAEPEPVAEAEPEPLAEEPPAMWNGLEYWKVGVGSLTVESSRILNP